MLYGIIYTWNLKDTTSVYNRKETDSQIWWTNLWLPMGKRRYRPLCINKLHGSVVQQEYSQYFVMSISNMGLTWWFNGTESTWNTGDTSSIPVRGTSPEGGHGNPLQYSSWRIPWTGEPGELRSMGSQSDNWSK